MIRPQNNMTTFYRKNEVMQLRHQHINTLPGSGLC